MTEIPKQAILDPADVGFELGKYVGMTRENYDSAPGLSHSMLKEWSQGKGYARPARGRVFVGNALHKRLESKELFWETYTKIDDVDLTKKEGKSYLADAEKSTGKQAIRESELKQVAGMFRSLASDDVGRAYIESEGDREVALFGKLSLGNTEHPTVMKGLIDLMAVNDWDVKTVGWATQAEFKNSIVAYGYDTQAALYRELSAAVRGEYRTFNWLCVHKQPPHQVWHEQPTNYMLSCGLRWLETTLSLYERWPTGVDDVALCSRKLHEDSTALQSERNAQDV